MKLIILFAVVACSNGAKLDRTYLPPNHAQTSGGSGNFLQTPISGPSQQYQNGLQASGNYAGNGFAQNDAYAQNGNSLAQNVNGFAQNDNAYVQSDNGFAQSDNGFTQNAGNNFAESGNFAQNGFNNFDNADGRPERAQAAFERNAAILRLENQNDGETYSYAFETENGISAEENGVATNGVEAQGGYSYTGDDGQVYSIRYTADQNGFQPQGDHLPTPPPIPEEILKALEQNAQDEANGIFDDGNYDEAKYGGAEDGQLNDNYESGNNYNNGNSNRLNSGGNYNNAAFDNSANDDDSVVTNNAFIRSDDGDNALPTFGNQNTPAEYGNLNTQARFGSRNAQSGFNNQNAETGFGNQNAQARFGSQNSQAGFGNQNVQSRFGNQNTQATFGNQNSQSFGNQNGVEKAYLPPFERNGQRGQARYNQQATSGFRNQPNDVVKSYQAPEQFGQRSQGQTNGRYNQRNGLSSQGSNGVENAYLPPFAQDDPAATGSGFSQDQTQNYRTQGQRGSPSVRNGANREYLPPTANQRSNGRGFRRGPSFNARNGYQY